MNVWELVTSSSTLPIGPANTFWDHLNNLGAGAGVVGTKINGVTVADATAIHTDEASEIAAIAEKTVTDAADLIVIEDAAAALDKKKAEVGNVYVDAGYW